MITKSELHALENLAPETTAPTPADNTQPDRIIAPARPLSRGWEDALEVGLLANLFAGELDMARRMIGIGNTAMARTHLQSALKNLDLLEAARAPFKTQTPAIDA